MQVEQKHRPQAIDKVIVMNNITLTSKAKLSKRKNKINLTIPINANVGMFLEGTIENRQIMRTVTLRNHKYTAQPWCIECDKIATEPRTECVH